MQDANMMYNMMNLLSIVRGVNGVDNINDSSMKNPRIVYNWVHITPEFLVSVKGNNLKICLFYIL